MPRPEPRTSQARRRDELHDLPTIGDLKDPYGAVEFADHQLLSCESDGERARPFVHVVEGSDPLRGLPVVLADLAVGRRAEGLAVDEGDVEHAIVETADPPGREILLESIFKERGGPVSGGDDIRVSIMPPLVGPTVTAWFASSSKARMRDRSGW